MSDLTTRTHTIRYANQEVARDCEAIQRPARCTAEGAKAISETYVYIEYKITAAEEMLRRIKTPKHDAESSNAEDEEVHALMRRRSFLNKVDRLMEYAGEETVRRVAQVTARDGTGRWPRFGR